MPSSPPGEWFPSPSERCHVQRLLMVSTDHDRPAVPLAAVLLPPFDLSGCSAANEAAQTRTSSIARTPRFCRIVRFLIKSTPCHWIVRFLSTRTSDQLESTAGRHKHHPQN